MDEFSTHETLLQENQVSESCTDSASEQPVMTDGGERRRRDQNRNQRRGSQQNTQQQPRQGQQQPRQGQQQPRQGQQQPQRTRQGQPGQGGPPGGPPSGAPSGGGGKINRRTVLAGGAAAAAAAAGGGWFFFLRGDSPGVSGGEKWVPSPQRISFSNIVELIDESELEDVYTGDELERQKQRLANVEDAFEVTRFSTLMTSPAAVEAKKDEIGMNNWQNYRNEWVNTGYAEPVAKDLDLVVNVWLNRGQLYRIHEGDFNPERIATRLDNETDDDDDQLYTETRGARDNIRYYIHEDNHRGYGFSNDVYIRVTIPESLRFTDYADEEPDVDDIDLVNLIDTALDSEEGTIEQYQNTSQDFAELLSHSNSGETVYYGMHDPDRYEFRDEIEAEDGEFEGHIGTLFEDDIKGSETNRRRVLLFNSQRDILERDIETYTQSNSFDGWREISWEVSGRAVIIEGSVRSTNF